MNRLYFFACLLLSGPLLSGQTPAGAVRLTISTDSPATLELDGKPVGPVEPGTPVSIDVESGEHQLVATPRGGGPEWRKLVLVSSSLANEVSIPLRAHLLRIEIETQGFWKDARTNLIWAGSDNGSGATVSQAAHYCRQLATGGFHDWRLPSIDELHSIFGGPADDHGYRILAPLKLSGWAWSATEGNEPAEHWTLDFGDGARASVAAGDAGLNRALCVRAGNR
jgi:hypothetical protein